MKHLTIRNVPPEVADRLHEERALRDRSLNQTVIDLLTQALGLAGSRKRSNGLAAIAGSWSAEEVAEFEQSTTFTEEIDDELWR